MGRIAAGSLRTGAVPACMFNCHHPRKRVIQYSRGASGIRRAIAYGYVELPQRASLPMSYSVMPGLVPGIHVVLSMPDDVD
ncbi:hypothetical protein ACQR1Q_09335, partial [Bradyrhizobium oligotrophicum]